MTDKTPSEAELLPCPFCGEAAKHSFNSLYGDMSMASCKSCGATAYAPKWNRRAVLAKWGQPAQAAEPVAVVVPCYTPSGKRVALYSAKQDLPIGTQLYTAPQPVERAPLTANQVSGLAESAGYWHGDMSRADFINGIRYAEAAHGIKGGQHGTE